MNTYESVLIEYLRQLKEVLEKYNVDFWLDCGTLLGAVREDKFLSWEKDIDLGAWADNITDIVKVKICKELSKKGFTVFMPQGYINYISIKKGKGESVILLDINIYSINKDEALQKRLLPKNVIGKYLIIFLKIVLIPEYYEINFKSKITTSIRSILGIVSSILPSYSREKIGGFIEKIYKGFVCEDQSWVVPSKYFTNLLTRNFYGMDFKVPAFTEEYLIYRYGENWRIPKKEWITARDDGSVIRSSD
ncbi:hypothetical protein CVT91_00255 [Candidatus Atribacteria bacterium HGW-Atribacteria-1]|nr:MAG: hypothetical protein CVT91_00255 [Candidatus Atribacteria bacterium HGW-Atribacteria-1]